MRKRLILFIASAGICASQKPAWQPAPGHITLELWPHGAPGAQANPGAEVDVTTAKDNLIAGKPVVRLGNVSTPTLTLYAAPGANTGAAVVVFPGGGYNILAIDLEGTEVCDWLNSAGINCILVKYRVPNSGPYPKSSAALQDAQRAFGIVRSHAAEWHIDPHRIGALGFSAGAHLAAALSTHFDQPLYEPVDAADQLSCRPDFAVIAYPGYLAISEQNFAPNADIHPTEKTPPSFILQAEDDPVHVENATVYFLALKNAKVPAELHIYAEGGHGYGLRRTEQPITAWPRLVETWLRSIHMMEPPHGSPLPKAAATPWPVLTHRVEPEYTAEARAAGVQGTVSLYVEIAPDGKTSHIRVLHGLPFGLNQKAVEAVEKWQFKSGSSVTTRQSVNVEFRLDNAGPWRIRMVAYTVLRNWECVPSKEWGDAVKPALLHYVAPGPAACPATGGRTVISAHIDTNGSPEKVVPSDGYSGPLADAVARAIKSWRFAPGSVNGYPHAANASIEVECGPPLPARAKVYQVRGGVSAPTLAFKWEPQYPEEARRKKVQGTSVLYVEIDPNGHAGNIHVVRHLGSGLDEKAMEAVAAWRFKPGMRDGLPVTVAATIQVNFRLL